MGGNAWLLLPLIFLALEMKSEGLQCYECEPGGVAVAGNSTSTQPLPSCETIGSSTPKKNCSEDSTFCFKSSGPTPNSTKRGCYSKSLADCLAKEADNCYDSSLDSEMIMVKRLEACLGGGGETSNSTNSSGTEKPRRKRSPQSEGADVISNLAEASDNIEASNALAANTTTSETNTSSDKSNVMNHPTAIKFLMGSERLCICSKDLCNKGKVPTDGRPYSKLSFIRCYYCKGTDPECVKGLPTLPQKTCVDGGCYKGKRRGNYTRRCTYGKEFAECSTKLFGPKGCVRDPNPAQSEFDQCLLNQYQMEALKAHNKTNKRDRSSTEKPPPPGTILKTLALVPDPNVDCECMTDLCNDGDVSTCPKNTSNLFLSLFTLSIIFLTK